MPQAPHTRWRAHRGLVASACNNHCAMRMHKQHDAVSQMVAVPHQVQVVTTHAARVGASHQTPCGSLRPLRLVGVSPNNARDSRCAGTADLGQVKGRSPLRRRSSPLDTRQACRYSIIGVAPRPLPVYVALRHTLHAHQRVSNLALRLRLVAHAEDRDFWTLPVGSGRRR